MNIVLAGSMKFVEKMRVIKKQLEDIGVIVTMPIDEGGTNVHSMRFYNDAALERLKAADILLVVNEDNKGITGRVGSNTLIEIGMAFALSKPIYLLNDYEKAQDCADELEGLTDGIVGADVELWVKGLRV